MARRSAMHERYQKKTAPAGKTRKSAAAAKPKRAAEGAPTKSASKSSTRSGRPPVVINPPTEEYRRMRRLWWILLATATAFTAASLAVRLWLPGVPTWVATTLLVLGYAIIFVALYIDMAVLRRLRREYAEQQKSGGKSGRSAKAERADKPGATASGAPSDAEGSSAEDKS